MYFESIEPFGKETQYYGPAMTTAMLANINRKKGTKPIKADEFVPKFEPPAPQPTSQMLSFAQNLTTALGGKDLRPEQDEED